MCAVNKEAVSVVKIAVQFVGIIEDGGERTPGIAIVPVTSDEGIILIKDDAEPCRLLINGLALKLGIPKITGPKLHGAVLLI